MAWNNVVRMAIEATCQQWWNPLSRPVLEMVGVVSVGVLVLAAAAQALGSSL